MFASSMVQIATKLSSDILQHIVYCR